MDSGSLPGPSSSEKWLFDGFVPRICHLVLVSPDTDAIVVQGKLSARYHSGGAPYFRCSGKGNSFPRS